MVEVRRKVFYDGWGLEIRWEGWILDFHRIQYPRVPSYPDQRFVDAWNGPERRGFTLHTDRDARLVERVRYVIGKGTIWEHHPAHDMMPLYGMCQKVRVDGGPGEPIVDWLQDRGLL